MTKIKVSEATNLQLDWMVAKAEGYLDSMLNVKTGVVFGLVGQLEFSSNWAQGGPIIEREGIATRRSKGVWYAMLSDDLGDGERAAWSQFTFRNVPKSASTSRKCRYDGPTQLIAAMRCYVASKLGDEVEVPEELLT